MSLVDNVRVRRGNVFLTISPSNVDRYLGKGYDIVDETGEVVKESTPNDVASLKIAYEKHIAEIERLKKEIAQLKSEQKTEKTIQTTKRTSKKD